MSLRIALIAAALVAAGLYVALRLQQEHQGPQIVSGFIEADEVRVGSRVGGRVKSVQAEEGERVVADATLIVLEPFDLQEQKARAEAGLEAARAELALLRQGLRPEEIAQARARRDRQEARLKALVAGPRPPEIAAAEAEVRLAEADVTFRRVESERADALMQSNIESQRQLDRAEFDLRAAEATLAARQAALDLLRLGTREEELREAEASLAEMDAAWRLAEDGYRAEEIERATAEVRGGEAALAAIERSIDELTVRAPIAGVIEAVDLQPGDLIAPNAPILTLIDDERLWVRTYIPEDRLDVRTGQELPISVDAWPGERFTGTVRFVARDAEFTPGNVQTPEDRSQLVFRAKVSLPPDAAGRLRAGMAATVHLPERN